MRKEKVALFGNGKGVLSAVTGLLKKEEGKATLIDSPRDITLIVRPETLKLKLDRINFFKKKFHGINVTTSVYSAEEAKYIIPAVTPIGAGHVLTRLGHINLSSEQEIISLISGVNPAQIHDSLSPRSNPKIIVGTFNTNIAYKKGIICATDYSELFGHLGTYIQEDFNAIQKSIVTIGSANGSNYRVLRLCYIARHIPMSLESWVTGLYDLLKNSCFDHENVPEVYETVCNYLQIESNILSGSHFNYSSIEAKNRACISMQSSLATLIRIGHYHPLTLDTLLTLEATVPTKGGCTEAGLNTIVSVEQLLDESFLSSNFFGPVKAVASTFPETVVQSIEKAKALAA